MPGGLGRRSAFEGYEALIAFASHSLIEHNRKITLARQREERRIDRHRRQTDRRRAGCNRAARRLLSASIRTRRQGRALRREALRAGRDRHAPPSPHSMPGQCAIYGRVHICPVLKSRESCPSTHSFIRSCRGTSAGSPFARAIDFPLRPRSPIAVRRSLPLSPLLRDARANSGERLPPAWRLP